MSNVVIDSTIQSELALDNAIVTDTSETILATSLLINAVLYTVLHKPAPIYTDFTLEYALLDMIYYWLWPSGNIILWPSGNKLRTY